MTKEGIRATFDGLGIEMICGSVIVRKKELSVWENIKTSNDAALELREFFGEFYYPGFHIHPDFIPESLAEIRRFGEKGFRLVGELVPYIHGWSDFSRKDFSYLLDACREHNMIVNIHTSDGDTVDKMVENHKDLTIVMAHPGEYASYMAHLNRMRVSENYYVDLSGTGLFRHAMLARGVKEMGAERFLFGSDYPTCNPAMFVGGVALDDLISPEDKEKILYSNAKKLLGLQ